MFNNLTGSKIEKPKLSIGQTDEDIKIIPKPKYSLSGNIAFIKTSLSNDEEVKEKFFLSKQQKTQLIHKNDPSELPNSKLK